VFFALCCCALSFSSPVENEVHEDFCKKIPALMLSTLSSVKSRLAIPDLNIEFDDLLTTALTALSARFDRETNRTLTRTPNTTHEFDARETESSRPIIPSNPSRNSKPNPPKPKAGSSNPTSITSFATTQS
jgi:hypothetical protein